MIQASRRSLQVDGIRRNFLLVHAGVTHIRHRERRPRPLVVFFHGTGQTGSRMRRFSGRSFDQLVESAGAIIAYPDGYRRDWNGARAINTPARRKGIDDVKFFHCLVDHLVEVDNVDPDRVYVVGFSLGGQMVMRLLHDAPERLAGAAVISSTQPAPANFVGDRTDRGKTVPLLLFHGTDDPLAPYAGGIVSVRGRFSRGEHLSAPDTAAYYARRNGHTEPPTDGHFRKVDQSESTSVRTTTYAADTAAPVILFSVEGGGHQVPNPTRVPTAWFWGHSTPDLCCADVIAQLFSISEADRYSDDRHESD